MFNILEKVYDKTIDYPPPHDTFFVVAQNLIIKSNKTKEEKMNINNFAYSLALSIFFVPSLMQAQEASYNRLEKAMQECTEVCKKCTKACETCSSDCKECSSDCKKCTQECKRCTSSCNECSRDCKECSSACRDCVEECKRCVEACKELADSIKRRM
ncbi:hypothetical protein HYX58_04290 [Candidatus Dependentiae bacterium]|nr:hypothetical protein [Candidatus Dependentiae bacterium]